MLWGGRLPLLSFMRVYVFPRVAKRAPSIKRERGCKSFTGAAALRTAAELLEDQGEDGAQRLCEALAGELAEAGAVPGALAVWRRLADDPALAPLGRALARAHESGTPVADAVARLQAVLSQVSRSQQRR